MTDQAISGWFNMHPFVRNEILLILGAVSGLAKKDWDTFRAYQVTQPHAPFDWKVAGFQYLQGVLIGGIPPLVAEVWKILGS